MNTINRLHEVMDQVDELHELLLRKYRTDPEEKKPGSWTMKRYKDLAIAIDDATDILARGLAGQYINGEVWKPHPEKKGG